MTDHAAVIREDAETLAAKVRPWIASPYPGDFHGAGEAVEALKELTARAESSQTLLAERDIFEATMRDLSSALDRVTSEATEAEATLTRYRDFVEFVVSLDDVEMRRSITLTALIRMARAALDGPKEEEK